MACSEEGGERMPTVPGWVKRLSNASASDSYVCCSESTCTKTFSEERTFRRELSVYERGLAYVPALVGADEEAMSITVRRVGVPLGTVWESSIPGRSPPIRERRRVDSRIRALHRRFRRDTGLYHNDVLYKNVLRLGRRLYLIDFESADARNTDVDMDGILATRPLSFAAWISYGLAAVVLALLGLRATHAESRGK